MPVYWPNGSLSMPRVTSEFNPARKNPVTGIVQPHNGIDLVGWVDNCSPVDGTVIFAGYNGGAGNEVRIRADGPTAFHVGDVFRILHHASLYVRTGQRVTARQPVGRMGTTGNSTGVHCHFETHEFRYGNPINPRDFMARANAAPSGGGSTSGDNVGNIDATTANKQVIKDAIFEFMRDAGPTVNGQPWAFMNSVWNQPVQVQDADGVPQRDAAGKPITYQAQGFLASAVAQLSEIRKSGVPVTLAPAAIAQLAKELAPALAPLLADHLGTLSDEDVQRLAAAAADENARRLAG